MKALHFSCDLTSLLRHRNPEKKDVYKNVVCYFATNVAIYYVINEFYKKRSESQTYSAEVGPEIVPTVTQGF